jgi:TPR repeat protein
MDETLCQELVAKTRQALDGEGWDGVEGIWQPLVEQGDAEAEFQLAYHYLWCTPCSDDATTERMKSLIRKAAARDHPDAIWFLATQLMDSEPEESREFERLLLRAGQLGSVNAQRALGVAYATGDWSGPKDLAEAARWYRLAAEKGHAESQYDLGFMLLLGEGEPKNTVEGLKWLERAAEQGEFSAIRLLADCYENGYCDVPVDTAKAAYWRDRVEEHRRANPPLPSLHYLSDGPVSEAALQPLWGIEGVAGFTFGGFDNSFDVRYDAELIGPAELDEKVRAVGNYRRSED